MQGAGLDGYGAHECAATKIEDVGASFPLTQICQLQPDKLPGTHCYPLRRQCADSYREQGNPAHEVAQVQVARLTLCRK